MAVNVGVGVGRGTVGEIVFVRVAVGLNGVGSANGVAVGVAKF